MRCIGIKLIRGGLERRNAVTPAGVTVRRWPARVLRRQDERRGKVPPRAQYALSNASLLY